MTIFPRKSWECSADANIVICEDCKELLEIPNINRVLTSKIEAVFSTL